MRFIVIFLQRNRSIYQFSLIILNFVNSLRFLFFYLIFRLIPVKRNKIVFSSFQGKGFGDNGKYIAAEILHQDNNYDLVWIVKKNMTATGLPQQIRPVVFGSIREIYELATAKIWIDNTRKPYFMWKRRSQFYIQTWHGSIGVKMVEKDALDTMPWIYVKTAKADSAMSNLYIANCKHIRDLYRNSFWYSGEIAMTGCPRNDIFFGNETANRAKIITHFGLEAQDKILLYAPTFRQEQKEMRWEIDFRQCLDALTQRWGGTWKVLMRLHPNRATQPLGIDNPSVINASLYDDMQELLAASDVLITDYSSSIFDYAIQYKPAFLFTPDVDLYLKERGFYFDMAKLPFPQSLSNSQFIEQIKAFDADNYHNKLSAFFKDQELCDDGNASKRIVERINKEIGY